MEMHELVKKSIPKFLSMDIKKIRFIKNKWIRRRSKYGENGLKEVLI